MQILPIANQEQWHKVRAQHIGGSEIAALFDKSPYTTKFELWHIKAGNIPAPTIDNERVSAGNYMEPAIAAWAVEKWGIKLNKFQGYAVNPELQGMGCTPDYINVDATLLVQIKNVDSLEFYKNPEWDAAGEILTKAPIHILLQCQYELGVTGIPQGWLVVCVGGNRLLRMEITAREKTIEKLKVEVKAFWDSVHLGAAPKPNYEADADAIAALNLNVDPEKSIDLSTSNRAHECVAAWLGGKQHATDSETLISASSAELMEMIGENGTAIVGDFIIKSGIVKASAGKPITPGMVGMIIGARKAYRNFSITTTKSGE